MERRINGVKGPELMKSNGKKIEQTIVAKALEQGASLAGIARVEDLKKSRSFEIYDKKPYYDVEGLIGPGAKVHIPAHPIHRIHISTLVDDDRI